ATADQSSKVATAIGAGFGVPLGVLALAGVGFVLFSRRTRDNGEERKKGGKGWDWYRGRGILRSGDHPQELSPDPTAPRQEMNTVQTPLEPPAHPPGFRAILIPPTPSSPESRAPQLPQVIESPPLMDSPHPLHPSYQPEPFPPPSRPPPSIEISPPPPSPSRSPPSTEISLPLPSPSLPLASPPAQPIQPALYPSHTDHPPHPFQTTSESSQPSPPSPHSPGSQGSVSSTYISEPLQSTEHPPQKLGSVQLPRPYGPPPGPPPAQIYPPPSGSQGT
ncbi:MAG: hypothetical protein M1835_001021, partial [Candelina submexicana]